MPEAINNFEPLTPTACNRVSQIRMPSVTLYQLPRITDGVRTQAGITRVNFRCSLLYDDVDDVVDLKLTNYGMSRSSTLTREELDAMLIDCCNEHIELHEHEDMQVLIDKTIDILISDALDTNIQLLLPERMHTLSGGYGALFDTGNAIGAFREFDLVVHQGDNKYDDTLFGVRINDMRMMSATDYTPHGVISMSYMMLNDKGGVTARYTFSNMGNATNIPVIRIDQPFLVTTSALSIDKDVSQKELDTMVYIQKYRPPDMSRTQSRFIDILKDQPHTEASKDTAADSTHRLRSRFASIEQEVR